MADFVWVGGGSGNWQTANNWDDISTNQNPSTISPGFLDTATFSGTSLYGAGNAATLVATNTNGISLDGTFDFVSLDGQNELNASGGVIDIQNVSLPIAGGHYFDLITADGGDLNLDSLSYSFGSQVHFGVSPNSALDIGGTIDTPGVLSLENHATLLLSFGSYIGFLVQELDAPTLDINGLLKTDDMIIDLYDAVGEHTPPNEKIVGAGTIEVLSGGLDAIGARVDSGSLTFKLDDNSSLEIRDIVGAGPAIDLANNATLNISGFVDNYNETPTIASTTRIAMEGTLDALQINSYYADGVTLSGFTSTDLIVDGGTSVSFTQTGSLAGVLTIYNSITSVGSIILEGNYSHATFNISNGGIITEIGVPCFCSGTPIRTKNGEVSVEDLRIGDEVLTSSNNFQKVRWIGNRHYDGRFIANNHLALPVCIHKGALADNVPSSDLCVSPGHGVWINGFLVPAWRLVNGISIEQATHVDAVHYFNVELEGHEILLVHNTPVESFLDDGMFRNQFQNAREYWAHYPDAPACRNIVPLPRVEGGFKLLEVQEKIKQRAGDSTDQLITGPLRGYVDVAGVDGMISGWAQNTDAPEAPVIVEILVDGHLITRVVANNYRADLRTANLGSGCHAFEIRLPNEIVGRVQVQRQLDGAPLAWTDTAQADAA